MTTEAFSDLDDLLTGGAPSAFKKADPVGSIFEGPIISIGAKQQQRDYATGEPKTYDDGNPMWQIPVTIGTDKRDPDIVGDDGARTLYLKGKLLGAVKLALRQAGNVKLRPGGHLWVQHTSTDREDKFEVKQYAARYTPAPPQTHTDADNLLSAPEPQLPGGDNGTYNAAPPVTAQTTNAATIAAKLAAATAVAPPPVVENPLVAGLSADQKAAIRNLTAEQAAAAALDQVWNALQ